MPKKYGSVKLNNHTNVATCGRCGYSWNATEDEIKEITENRTLSCLKCRAMKELVPDSVVRKNTEFKLASFVLTDDPDKLRGEAYKSQKVRVVHSRCRRTIEITLQQLHTGDIKCTYCATMKTRGIEEKDIKEIQRDAENIKESKKHILGSVKTTPVIRDGTTETENITKEIEDIAQTRAPSTGKNVQSALGKLLKNGHRIMEANEEKGSCKVQCVYCGLEETYDLETYIRDLKADKVKCSRCGGDGFDIDELKRKYMYKVFNGLKIYNIYIDENKGIPLCDTLCLQQLNNSCINDCVKTLKTFKKVDSSSNSLLVPQKSIHTMQRVPLGDMINKRVFCDVCGHKKLVQIPNILHDLAYCRNLDQFKMDGKVSNNHINMDDVELSDIYNNLNSGSICDYCPIKDKCKYKGIDPRNSLAIRMHKRDLDDSLLAEVMQITADYPSMIEGKQDDIDAIAKYGNGLIVIKEAYTGRDGKVYRTCKCHDHGTELVLNDQEIEDFDHEQCKENHQFMRFFDLPKDMYLK